MMWFLVVGIVIALAIAFTVITKCRDGWYEWTGLCAGTCWVVGTIMALLIALVALITPVNIRAGISEFNSQKAYLETHDPKSEIEDAALTTKKIELNGWLFGKQGKRAEYGAWSFIPDEIMEVEPIK